jgi:hypothetical protein
VIEIADAAFEMDKDIEDQSTAKVKEFDLAGKLKTTLPSQRTMLHEVGHGEESAELRIKEAERFKVDLEVTKKGGPLKTATDTFINGLTSIPSMSWSDGKEKAYYESLIGVAKSFDAVRLSINEVDADASHAELKKSAKTIDSRITAASKSIAKRNKARGSVKSGSAILSPTIETAQDASLDAAKAMLKALEGLRDARAELEKGKKAEKKASAEIKLGGKETGISRRLAELVALINLKKIKIKGSGLSDYVTGKWPDDPGEVFAELYQMSVTEKEAIKKFDPDVAEFFDSPIGAKGKWKSKVDDWIKSH